MAEKTLTGSIDLTKLVSAITERKGKNGMVRGVFIPIEHNHLTEKDGRIYCDLRIIVRDEKDKYDQNGFIAKNVPKDVYQSLKDDQDALREKQPILGNVRDWSTGSASTPEPAEEVGEDDDVHF